MCSMALQSSNFLDIYVLALGQNDSEYGTFWCMLCVKNTMGSRENLVGHTDGSTAASFSRAPVKFSQPSSRATIRCRIHESGCQHQFVAFFRPLFHLRSSNSGIVGVGYCPCQGDRCRPQQRAQGEYPSQSINIHPEWLVQAS